MCKIIDWWVSLWNNALRVLSLVEDFYSWCSVVLLLFLKSRIWKHFILAKETDSGKEDGRCCRFFLDSNSSLSLPSPELSNRGSGRWEGQTLLCLASFMMDKQAERRSGRQLLTQLQIRSGVSGKPVGARLTFIRHDRLTPPPLVPYPVMQ